MKNFKITLEAEIGKSHLYRTLGLDFTRFIEKGDIKGKVSIEPAIQEVLGVRSFKVKELHIKLGVVG